MMKIAVYGNKAELKQTEDILSQCLKEKGISYEIHHVSYSNHIIKDYLYNHYFKLCIIISKGTIVYIIKTYTNLDLGISRCITGTAKFPLTYEEFNRNIIEKIELSWICPYGAYIVKKRGLSRKILHDKIEYIHREKDRTIIYLSDGDKEQVTKSTARIFKELDKKHFIKCSKGYVVNFFNVKKISHDFKTLYMKSGAEVPISKMGRKKFLKALSIIATGNNIFCD